jgi:hypothetical protein
MEFNACAKLFDSELVQKLQDSYSTNTKPLQTMMQLQNQLQLHLQDKLPHNLPPSKVKTKGELIDCLDANFDAIMDEFRELKTSVGGMSNGDKVASAVWKRWKSDNLKMRSELISDMSEEDRLEMKFEMIDILHFVMNMASALGISYEELYVLYMLKNKENFRRYNSGY